MQDFSYTSKFYNFNYTNGIFHLTYMDGPITLEVAKDLVKQRINLTKSENVLMLVTVQNLKGIERGARTYLSSKEGIKGVQAGAIVTKTAFTKHLANFFIQISFKKSKMQAKIFSNKKDAINWLRGQK